MGKTISIDKYGKKLTAEQVKNGIPVLKLKCIETFSDAGTNMEYFTKDYVYFIVRVNRHSLTMQTNFPDLEAEIEMDVIKKIFAGFGKQNEKAIKSI